MRLLDTTTKQLKEFPDPGATPEYAILSHRWREEEVSFQDIQDIAKASKLKGYAKILACCAQAAQDGYPYIWVDTCCIDKTSSAELSEGINSMFSWYRNSEVCYAYLDDVPGSDLPESEESEGSDFRKSEWFTRGWTLQELIAPSSVIFFSKSWVEIGTKASLASVIESITKVNRNVLYSTVGEEVSVAQRMSWAAGRKTTREEDRAYSLMGLFGVTMPTIYGEGKRAFIRLQHEIMKTSNDCTLFVWRSSSLQNSGLLAPSPDEFAGSAWVSRTPYDAFVSQWGIRNPRPHYELTNYGVHMQLPVSKVADDASSSTYSAYLPCGTIGTQRGPTTVAIILRQNKPDDQHHFVRTALDNIFHYANSSIRTTKVKVQDVYVKEIDPSLFNIIDYAYISPSASYVFKLTMTIPDGYRVAGFTSTDPGASRHWKANSPTEYIYTLAGSGGYGLILLQNDRASHWVAIALGAHNWRIWSDIVDGKGKVTADGVVDVDYNYEKGRRGQVRWQALDWISKQLEDGSNARLTVRKAKIGTEIKGYIAKFRLC